MIKKIISIKNNKETSNSIIYAIKGKKTKNILAYLIRLEAYTTRRNNRGKNIWDVYYLISTKKLNYKLGQKGIKLGNTRGIDYFIDFTNYEVEAMNNIKYTLNLSKREIREYFKQQNEYWKYGLINIELIEQLFKIKHPSFYITANDHIDNLEKKFNSFGYQIKRIDNEKGHSLGWRLIKDSKVLNEKKLYILDDLHERYTQLENNYLII
jgi:hypothetical protein